MGRQSRPSKPECFGKDKVTPIQVAFIVDRYLCDNNFAGTRNMFRTEASSLIANSPQEAPKTLLSLGDMLNEYICLKEQKVMVDQERVCLDQDKYRIQMLLQGMQNVMNTFNASGGLPAPNVPAPPAKSAVPATPQPQTSHKSPSGVPTPMQKTMTTYLLSVSSNENAANTGNLSTTQMKQSDRKRKETLDAPSASKRSRGRASTRKTPSQGPSLQQQSENAINNQVVSQPPSIKSPPSNSIPSGSQVQGSTVAKCLFNQPSFSNPTTSPVPKTPPRSNSSHSDSYTSPPESSSVANSRKSNVSKQITPTGCTVISTKRVMVSPAKQMAYIESSRCISPVKIDSKKINKKDLVQCRLDFDGTDMPQNLDKPLPIELSTPDFEKETGIFDIDLHNFEGLDFSLSDFSDLDLHFDDIDFSSHPTSRTSKDNDSGSPDGWEANQIMSELSSTMKEALSEKDMNIQGWDYQTAFKNVTNCMTISSPVKNRLSSMDQENCVRLTI